MPVTVTMPPVSEAAAEATVGVWLRQPGDAVVEGEPLLEIVSDKVTLEVPAPASGVLGAIAVQEGETAAVGAPIATIVLPGEADPRPAASRPTMPAAPSTPSPATPSAISPPPAAPAKPAAAGAAAAVPAGNSADIDGRRLYTPRVRRLAAEHGLSEAELAGLRGSGLGGRLTSEELLAYLAQRPAPAATAVAAPSAPPAPATPAAATPPAPAPRCAPPSRRPRASV
jgi:2-oxoglutarate dehydrogenase E2 component (dihydrolipoamide succinyltransferase)